MNLTMDYAALKRGLSRRIKQAKKDGDSNLIISVDFASNILIALEHIAFIARADKEEQT